MWRSNPNKEKKGVLDWELRPGGMLVQKRSGHGVGPTGRSIKVLVSHASYLHEVNVPAQATFGEVKRIVGQETGLEPTEQRILFRGKEKENEEWLHMEGVKDMSKLVLMVDPASRDRKLIDQGVARACEAVARVRAEVDKLADKVCALESEVECGGKKIADKEFVVLTELLMVQLLKLDAVQAEGEAKSLRRVEVRRVQSHVDKLDMLKARNAKQFAKKSEKSNGHTVAVSVNNNKSRWQWESFGSSSSTDRDRAHQ